MANRRRLLVRGNQTDFKVQQTAAKRNCRFTKLLGWSKELYRLNIIIALNPDFFPVLNMVF